MQNLFLREVTMADARLLLDWRNESSVRENSFHTEIIAYEEHVKWLSGKLADSDEIMKILMLGEETIGQIRLSKDENGIEISYSIDKDFRGYGYGKEIIRLGEAALIEKGYAGKLTALVKKGNKASQNIFLSLEYQEREKEEFFEYTKILGQAIYIRVDMNPVIATGHVMRCLSIADEICRIGGKVVFITADECPVEMIGERGYETLILHSDWQNMEGELPQLFDLIREYEIKNLLVDSYQVTSDYLQVLKEKLQVTYLDDLDEFDYPVNQLICYANYYDSFSYGKKNEKDGYYLGMKYVPLRGVFQNCAPKEINESVNKVLLLSGGSDSYNIIEKMVEHFKDNKNVTLITICGRFYEGYEELVERYKAYPNLVFRQNVSNLEDYMKDADLAVSAGGTTLYELSAVGTPTISYSFADNQLYNVKQFAKDEMIEYAGDVRYEDIFAKIEELYHKYNHNKELRAVRSATMQQKVDGRGAERIAKVLLKQNVT